MALDGASAVRKVNLATRTAGTPFSLSGNSGVYATPPTAVSLAALPGATDSVIVATNGGYSTPALAIHDSGVSRGTAITSNSSYPYALQVDGTRNEIYTGGAGYYIYTYSSSGLALKATGSSSATFASYSFPEFQVAGGRTYTDFGGVYDAESGALLGTRYVSGTTVASGPTVADITLGKVFTLDNATNNYNSYNQIQAFNISDFNISSATVIPVSVVYGSSSTTYPTTLTRWGTNGLAFRTAAGVFSVRSNLVKDLSSVSADLSVVVSASGGTTTGTSTTYTATVSNAGPSTATNVALVAVVPSTGTLTTTAPSAGSCTTTAGTSCNLGSLSKGSTATVMFTVLQTTAGSATLTSTVSGSETDPTSSNNQSAATVTVTGSTYASVPTLGSISPAAILSGSGDTIITVTGTGFASSSSVLLGGTALPTSYVSSTKLTATVPTAKLASLGWSPVTISNPSPGGGVSGAMPLSVYSVITLGLNHIVYDPYSQKIMASVGSGSSTITGNSIVAITPETQSVGTPVPIGSQPTNLSLTSDGQVLYTILSGAASVARFNMLTQQADFTYAVAVPSTAYGGVVPRGIAAQPGTENTLAIDLASYSGNAIYDFNPSTKTAAIRGANSGPYSGSCISFLDSGNLLAFDVDTSGSTLDHYTVTSAGFTYYNYQQYTQSTLLRFGCFKVDAGLAYSINGGVANPATNPATQLGTFGFPSGYAYAGQTNIAPDTSLQRVFCGIDASSTYSSTFNAVQAFDTKTYLPTASLPLAVSTIEGNTSTTVYDLIRWGQDGLALLSSGGHLYILRGAAVVPQLLGSNSPAVLTSSSTTSVTHGAGNTLFTLTGNNFVPGVAVTWNGSYRTTTIVDATHVTVAIPANDLASAGTGSLVATNPGASASGTLTVTVN